MSPVSQTSLKTSVGSAALLASLSFSWPLLSPRFPISLPLLSGSFCLTRFDGFSGGELHRGSNSLSTSWFALRLDLLLLSSLYMRN